MLVIWNYSIPLTNVGFRRGGSFSIFSRKKKDTGGNSQDEYFLGRSEHFEWRAQSGRSSVVGSDWIVREGLPYLEKVYAVYKNEILQLGDANSFPIRVSVRPSH